MPDGSGKTDKRYAGLIPWQPGKSGNPSGRPKGSQGLAARIRERTQDGKVILDYLMSVLTGKEKATPKDRLDAAKILLDRGYGKAIETQISLTAGAGGELAAQMADEQLERLARQLVASVAKPPESLGFLEEAVVVEVPPSPLLTSPHSEQADERLVSDAGIGPAGGGKIHADGGDGGAGPPMGPPPARAPSDAGKILENIDLNSPSAGLENIDLNSPASGDTGAPGEPEDPVP